MIFVLHIDQSEFLSLVLTDEIDQFSTLLNFIETLDKLISKRVNPLNKLILDIDQCLPNALFPFSDYCNGWLIFYDCLACVFFDSFKFFQLLLVSLIDVVQIFLGNDTL